MIKKTGKKKILLLVKKYTKMNNIKIYSRHQTKFKDKSACFFMFPFPKLA